MRTGELFFEYPIVQIPYSDPDAPYGIPLSSLHPWVPPPPPAPPAEVFEEDDDEMAQADHEVPPVLPEMDGIFPPTPMAAPVDDVPDPPLANGHISSSSEEDPEEDPAWEDGQCSDSSDEGGAGVGRRLCPMVISAVLMIGDGLLRFDD
ncbi:hypothetical protein PIB30_046160, partial [Stylosanthes scabra]|nr:hypothetical protein [Stylosanthes scabra]